MFLYFIFIIAMEKLNNIKEGTHKRNPIKMGSLTSKQLKELLHPTRTEEQKAAIEEIKSKMQSLKKIKNTMRSEWVKQDIKKAQDLGVDTTRYEKKLSVLEKEACMNDIIDCFTKSDKYPDTTTFKEALVKHLKKGLSLGITNDELNTKLISFVGQAIEDQQKAYKITLEKNQPNKEHILNYHSKEIKFLEDQLKEIKENPIDFTVFLDDQS